MKIEIKNRYSNARLYQEPPCNPIPKEEFVSQLKDGVKFICEGRSQKFINLYSSHVNLLQGYLNKYSIKTVVPDEDFFDILWKRTQADTSKIEWEYTYNEEGKKNGLISEDKRFTITYSMSHQLWIKFKLSDLDIICTFEYELNK